MELVCPKKGIYKDGHEREDTVVNRGVFGLKIFAFKDRETTYSGGRLEIAHPPIDSTLPEIIRLYHDECIFASHEGTLQLWVVKGTQANYRKPRGHIIMASGFICRYHGMITIPAEEVERFLVFLADAHGRKFTVEGDFPKSSKIYKDTPATQAGSLCSFTLIEPGKNKGDYWVCDDVCEHLRETVYLSQWVHRREDLPLAMQPEVVAIFDGSSNHAARSSDALHVDGDCCLGPGGKNAPGSPPTAKRPENPKMRDGWYRDEVLSHVPFTSNCFLKSPSFLSLIKQQGNVVVQQMHRAKTPEDDAMRDTEFANADGTIFKGITEILQEGGVTAYWTAGRCRNPARRPGGAPSTCPQWTRAFRANGAVNPTCFGGGAISKHSAVNWRKSVRRWASRSSC